MRTKYFEYAKEIARYGSITKTAENLYISQQALSEALKLLEDSLGFPIFTRTNKGVQITKNGEQFLSDLDIILPILERWKQLGSPQEHVKSTVYLQYLLNDLMMHEPLRDLQLYDVNWEPCAIYDVFEHTSHNKDSIGLITATAGTKTESDLLEWTKQKGRKADRLSSGRMSVVLQKDDPLCDKPALQMSDFYGRQIVINKIFGNTPLIQRFIKATGRDAYLLPETINVMMFLTHAEKGTFTYEPEEIIKQSSQVKNGNLVLRHLEQDKKQEMVYYLIYHEVYERQNAVAICKIKEHFATF